MHLFCQECKMNLKMLLIWAFCVGGLSLGCLCLYDSVEESMGEMSEAFADMGVFSEALGMDKIGIGTLEGYYAVEISILISLGGAMFAAMLGAGIVAKEEEGHTCEFLNALPLSRGRIIGEKYAAMVVLLAVFHGICVAFSLVGFAWMESMPDMGHFAGYHGAVFLMCLEIGTICFLLSALQSRKPLGLSIGIAVLLYLLDLFCRVVPALEKLKVLNPFSYSNGADIFSGIKPSTGTWAVGTAATVLALGLAVRTYWRRDLV